MTDLELRMAMLSDVGRSFREKDAEIERLTAENAELRGLVKDAFDLQEDNIPTNDHNWDMWGDRAAKALVGLPLSRG